MVIRDGLVALEHYNQNPSAVKIDETHYSWIPQNNVSLCWVREEHVDRVLQVRARICCGKTKPRFFYASQKNVEIWEGNF